MTDRPAIRRYCVALRGVSDVVGRVPEDGWQRPSPCPPWTATDLLDHLVDGQAQIATLLSGAAPDLGDGEGGQAERWAAAVAAIEWAIGGSAPDALVTTPLGPRSVDELLAVGVVEPLLHAWDLAMAAGLEVALDADAVHATLEGVRALGPQLAASGMYADALPCAPGAGEQDQLLAATGRRPPGPVG